jgi:eukaryotic-like serine/threonine-protein kinase
MVPEPGMMVTSNLRLVELLGEGGMGSVWIAEQVSIGARVAVKFIATNVARPNTHVVARFKREAAIAARIKSPHVVQVIDFGTTGDGTPYLAMELLEGETLQQRLKRTGAISTRDTALIVAQVAQALGKAHALGIVHRDVKPANLYLIDSAYGLFVKVLDFGVAKFADTMGDVGVTATGAMLGSPLYMSPEQFASAKDADARADVWSLAVVAYQCLTGDPAFQGESFGQVMLAVVHRKFRPVSTVRGDLPGALDALFAKAFADDIGRRFQSADELAKDFLAISKTTGSEPLVAIGGTMGEDLSKTLALPDAPVPMAPVPMAPVPMAPPPEAPHAAQAVSLGAGTLTPSSQTMGGAPSSMGRWVAAGAFGLVAVVGLIAVVALRSPHSDTSAPESVSLGSTASTAGTEPPSLEATPSDPSPPLLPSEAAGTETEAPTPSSSEPPPVNAAPPSIPRPSAQPPAAPPPPPAKPVKDPPSPPAKPKPKKHDDGF